MIDCPERSGLTSMNHLYSNHRKRQGVILSFLAILGIFLIVAVMFFVDVAYMQLTRTELQAATDAAAKAACESIAGAQTEDEIVQTAIDAAALNTVGGQAFALDPEDIVVGQSQLQPDGRWQFQPGMTPFTAVQVTGTKSNDKASGAVNLFFAGAMGSGEFTPTQAAVASQFDHEIMLCVDRSHSMCFDFSGTDWAYPSASEDSDWNPQPESDFWEKYCMHPHAQSRWGVLHLAVNAFLNTVEENNAHQQQRIGLVTWGSQYNSPCGGSWPASRVDAQLGLNFNQVRNAMNGIKANPIQGGTNMSAGLNEAIGVLTGATANPLAKKTIILFTDGQWNNGSAPSSVTAAASQANITIHIVSLLDNLDMSEMDDLAETNTGIHYNASTEAELVAAFETLAKSLPCVLTE